MTVTYRKGKCTDAAASIPYAPLYSVHAFSFIWLPVTRI